MQRFLLAILMGGGLWLGASRPAMALDYAEPIVPPELRATAEGPAPGHAADATAPAAPRMPRTGAPSQTQNAAPTRDQPDAPGRQVALDSTTLPVTGRAPSTEPLAPDMELPAYTPPHPTAGDSGGCALWDWDAC